MSGEWIATRIEIVRRGMDGRADPIDVPGYTNDVIPGLAVTQGIGSLAGLWCVTHVRSGRLVEAREEPGFGFGTFDDAVAMAKALGALGDWDRDARKILRDTRLRAAARALVAQFRERATSATVVA